MNTFTLSVPVLCIICFFVFLAGFVDAAAGGGGLISLPAYIATGMPAHFAYGCNKFSSACGTTLASARFLKNRALDIRTALLAAAGSFIGSGIAAQIVLLLDDRFLKREYQELFPREWWPHQIVNRGNVGKAIRDFWKERKR